MQVTGKIIQVQISITADSSVLDLCSVDITGNATAVIVRMTAYDQVMRRDPGGHLIQDIAAEVPGIERGIWRHAPCRRIDQPAAQYRSGAVRGVL